MPSTFVHQVQDKVPTYMSLSDQSIGIDNRCSASISHKIGDFVGQMYDTEKVITGYGGIATGKLKRGTLIWNWEDDGGKIHHFKIPNSYYAPSGGMRLLSPQHWAKETYTMTGKVASQETLQDRVIIHWGDKQYNKTVMLHAHTNVATMHMSPNVNEYSKFLNKYNLKNKGKLMCYTTNVVQNNNTCSIQTTSEETEHDLKTVPRVLNLELDKNQREENSSQMYAELDPRPAELLKIHKRYNHISMISLQHMARAGIIPKRLATCDVPACKACLYGKAIKKKWRDRFPKIPRPLKIILSPGQVVSTDQLISPTPGLIAQMLGKPTVLRYTCATIYVDHYSGYTYVHMQHTQDAEHTVKGKLAFEAHASTFGVKIGHYHADNGIFNATLWRQSCEKNQQGLSFAGVNTHHQNGLAERRIRTLQELTRTSLNYACQKWKKVLTFNLWPYAMRTSNDALNNILSAKHNFKYTPLQKFAGVQQQVTNKDWHHFGCPAYVLKEELQGYTNIYHKWKDRARIGVYLGKSPQHATSVSLVLNIHTGLTSPQFHVKMDSTFETVKDMDEDMESLWQIKCGFTHRPHAGQKCTHDSSTWEYINKSLRLDPQSGEKGITSRNPTLKPEGVTLPLEGDILIADNPDLNISLGWRSQRVKSPIERLTYVHATELMDPSQNVIGEIGNAYPPSTSYPLTIHAASMDPDTMYLHQAKKQEDLPEFKKAISLELQAHLDNKSFILIKKKDLPEGHKALPAVWAMKRKRRVATGEIYKWKARLNIDGSKQIKGLHYDESFSPVASWESIRTIMVIAMSKNWHMRQVDYVQAFPQAPVERELYMKIPQGLNLKNHNMDEYFLKILRNIYGQVQAGKVWHEYLIGKLMSIGFTQCQWESCILIRGQLIYILYIDDSIIIAPELRDIEECIQEIKNTNLKLTDEGIVSEFLGVKIERRGKDTILFSQPTLIKTILQELRLLNNQTTSTPKDIPMKSSKILSRHPTSKDFDGNFHYRRLIGMLNYLERCSRPDISYAVHQCARFCEEPKVEHGLAVKLLGRYLLNQPQNGIIATLSQEDIVAYVDADFAGNWDPEISEWDKDTARSRHGYIIMYRGIPISWASQLQTEIALSSTESEFIGLSALLRKIIPILELLQELNNAGFAVTTTSPVIRATVYEDNEGARAIANVPKMRPRTKHLNVKYHHFRTYIDSDKVMIESIDTDEQPADMMTKPVNLPRLRKHRRKAMGW